MDEKLGQAPLPAKASVAGTATPRWDTSAMTSQHCALATATATDEEVILNFGAKVGLQDAGAAVSAELLRRIALRPVTAKHLKALLTRAIGDYDQPRRRR